MNKFELEIGIFYAKALYGFSRAFTAGKIYKIIGAENKGSWISWRVKEDDAGLPNGWNSVYFEKID